MNLPRTTGPGSPLTPEDRRRPGQVRRVGWAHAALWGFGARADAVGLCLSELVTNGFVHGDGDVGVRMWPTQTQLCIEVSSSGPERVPPTPSAVDLLDEGGRGLLLVAAHADVWGIAEDGPLTRMWCAFGSGDAR
ncbi:ATP-binding protein [Streptomyces sp. NPDC059256]|uniref:ATP-binding protein n=1 Tax=Streptomyces sp. NPDC059256 TaxID=3346794 RepID=UPI0036CEC422